MYLKITVDQEWIFEGHLLGHFVKRFQSIQLNCLFRTVSEVR